MQLSDKIIRWLFILLLLGSIIFAATRLYSSGKDRLLGLKSFFSSFSFRKLISQTTTNQIPTISPSPTPYIYHLPSAEQQQYILALGAILSGQNNERTTDLKSTLNRNALTQVVDQSWGITDRETALSTLNWLRDEGHRTELNGVIKALDSNNVTTQSEFDHFKQLILDSAKGENVNTRQITFVLDFAWENRDTLKDKSLYAWDYGRLVNVTRWCYTLGWISEEEAWTYLVPAAQILQTKYTSWADYGENYILGRGFWLNDLSQSVQQKSILKYLTTPENETPWNTINWNTPL